MPDAEEMPCQCSGSPLKGPSETHLSKPRFIITSLSTDWEKDKNEIKISDDVIRARKKVTFLFIKIILTNKSGAKIKKNKKIHHVLTQH